MTMLLIDGAAGEGGGQILRSSLALSLVTGKPFRLTGLRARRARPGLLRQHLTALKAAQAIGCAEVTGAELGSREVTFVPQHVNAGHYTFAVGTAGSATLVFQTVLPALMIADGPSTLVLEGGTHNPAAPPFEFLERAFLPIVNRMGPNVSVKLERPGFYPAGGGRFTAKITPAKLSPIDLMERGAVRERSVRAVVVALPRRIAEREIARLAHRLGPHAERGAGRDDWPAKCFHVEEANAQGPGNVVHIEIASEHVTEVFTGFGERGVRAETVADRVADEALAYLAADVPVGQHLADQLLLLFALAGGGQFRTLPLSAHARTQQDIIEKFLESSPRAIALG
jgi:RNA 3'-terminal phosphate cyclase (ATP)